MSVVIDHRSKHHVKENAESYLYIKYPLSHIFYIQYIICKNKVFISTRKKTPEEAFKFAMEHRNKAMQVHRISKKKVMQTFYRKALLNYYKEDSEWLKYDIAHGSKMRSFVNTVFPVV